MEVSSLKSALFLNMTPCCLGDGYLPRHCCENLKYGSIFISQNSLLFFLYNLLHRTFVVHSASLYLSCKA
jgi:hypothetical protein